MPSELFSLLGMLLAVVAVLLLAHWATKRLANGLGGMPGVRRDSGMRILTQLALGKDQRLLVVQVAERCLLLGATPNGITVLAELTEEERAVWMQNAAQPGAQQSNPSFQEALRSVLAGRKKK